jgi:hypothetical protein
MMLYELELELFLNKSKCRQIIFHISEQKWRNSKNLIYSNTFFC